MSIYLYPLKKLSFKPVIRFFRTTKNLIKSTQHSFFVDKMVMNVNSLATIPARPIHDAQIGGLLFLQPFVGYLRLKGGQTHAY